MRDGVKPQDVPVAIQANCTEFTAQDVGAGQKIDNAQLSFTVAGGVMTGKGERRSSAFRRRSICARRPRPYPADQARAHARRCGASETRLHAGKTITGPMPIEIAPASDGGPSAAFDVEAD